MSVKETPYRLHNREELIKKIALAEKSLSIIGVTVFDLPWKKLIDGDIDEKSTKKYPKLSEKFFADSSVFQIRILRESENLIAQYALLSQGNSNSNGNSISRGNLTGVKEAVLKELKNSLMVYAKEHKIKDGLEPPEDVYKDELTKIANNKLRTHLLKVIESEKQTVQLVNKIRARITNYLSGETSLYFEKVAKEFGYDQKLFDGAAEFQRYVTELAQKIADAFSTIESLNGLNVNSVLEGLGDDRYNKKEGKIKYPIVPNPTDDNGFIIIGCSLEQKIQEVIASFRVDGNTPEIDDINYLLDSARIQAEKIASKEMSQKISEYSKDCAKTAQRLFIKDCYMPIPVHMIEIDNELYITHALTRFDAAQKFQYIGKIDSPELKYGELEPYRSYWITEFKNYYNRYFMESEGVQRYSTEETSKGDRKEVIDIFNESRVRVGTGPRDAFLSNMSIVKSVVWALIFDRKGRMLIHQRAMNAKDNRGLWDKSVGGHVSVDDLDTIEAVKREVTEELYTLENEGQGGHDKVKWHITNKNKIIYLGTWHTGRYPDFRGLNLNSDEYYAFSLNFLDINKKDFRTEIVTTERVLPSGETLKAKCFVDPYLCIVANDFDISKLQNSKYAMLTPNELRTCVKTGKIQIDKVSRCYDSNADEAEFKATSDLVYLVNSSLWDDVVTEFSKRIRDSFRG